MKQYRAVPKHGKTKKHVEEVLRTCWEHALDQNLSISCKTEFVIIVVYPIAQNLWEFQMGQMCAFWEAETTTYLLLQLS